MSAADAEFWRRDDHDYHDLAERFEKNIEIVHPGLVSSNRLAPWSYYGMWNTTAVVYYEHRGPGL